MKYRYILSIVLAGACLSACHDFRDDHMVEDTVYLRSESDALVQDFSVYDAVSRFGVIKSGKGRSAATVTLGIAPTDSVLKYNELHKTDYLPLGRSFYNADELDGKVLNLAAAEARAKVDVSWDPRTMVAEMQAGADDYVIPVYIKEASIDISKTKYMVLIHPVLSTLSVRAQDNFMTCKEGSTFTGKVGLLLSNPIPGHDVRVKLAYTPEAVTVSGASYEAAPEGAIKLVTDEVTIKAGNTEVDVEVDLDMNPVAAATTRVSGKISVVSVTVMAGEGLDFMPVTAGDMIVRVDKTK